MSSASQLPYYTAKNGSATGMFNTAMGNLQRQLYNGEYYMFKYAPIFESDFIQITRSGELTDMHNRVPVVTVGIACTSPVLVIPDVMLLAQPLTGCAEHGGQDPRESGCKAEKTLELTRLLPLKFVKITIYDHEKQQLRLKFITGRACYLQLCPPSGAREDLFIYWEKLVHLLQLPVDSDTAPAGDVICTPVLNTSVDGKGSAAVCIQEKEGEEQISVPSPEHSELSETTSPEYSELSEATYAFFAGGEGGQNASYKPARKTKLTHFATRVAEWMAMASSIGKGAINMAATKSMDLNQINTVSATKHPGRSKTCLPVAGISNMPSKSIRVAVAAVSVRFSEGSSMSDDSSSLFPETSSSEANWETELTSEGVTETDGYPGEEIFLSTLLSGGTALKQAKSQQVFQAKAAAWKKRERKESRSAQSPKRTKSPRKTGGEKMRGKSSSQSIGSQRAPGKNKGHSSLGGSRPSTRHKGATPITKESRASHKSERSLLSSGSTTDQWTHQDQHFLMNRKASLTRRELGLDPAKGDMGSGKNL
ncbi:protein FAM71A [Orycteropus afer afer]|uniref:Protein FAM71A n=1 Tax=Orycteropus afer afer TaxID=1230840 RepID=A0A8B7AWC2_ORYAF|nr:protein FAM71A [Orycteropus afer afer]